MRIRPFHPGDEAELRQVFFQAVRTTAAADYSSAQIAAWAPETVDPDKWAARMRGIQPFVAEDVGQILGFADLQPDGYIDMFFVRPIAGRRGVGRALMQTILATAQARAIPSLYSHVSLTARPFFEKFGFVAGPPQTVWIGDIALTNFPMRKSLEVPAER